MLRLFTAQSLSELWKCSHFVASCVAKRRGRTCLPVSRRHIPARHFATGTPAWKDALHPNRDDSDDLHTLDLDKWKSVMRAQAASEEKRVADDDEEASDGDGDDDDDLTGADLKDNSSLEATRDLIAMWRLAGKLVPEEMTDEELQSLADLTTKSARKKYLKYLALKEGHKKARKKKQEQKKAEREQRRASDSDDDEEKRPQLRNTMFLQFWHRSMDKHMAWRSAQAMQFGQPLVFDMSYESNMGRREVENTVSQLQEVEAWNRRADEPYHLHFCNLQTDGAYHKELLKRYGAETWDRILVSSSEKQHVDLFPREQLVYLTADSRNVLHKYDHSKVYIIGALVDRTVQSGLSLANAKRLNLATARLPLDEYLHWEMGAKTLTLDQMIRIMLTIKETGKWEEALKFVPQRKHDGFHQQGTQRERSRARGFTAHRQKQNSVEPLRFGERNSESKFKNEGLSLHRPSKGSGFTNQPAGTRVRTSFKTTMEGRKGAGKGKMWWDK